jgi:hypothetical protein
MLTARRFLALALISGAVAGCGETPTLSADAARAAFDGGHTLGSGHRQSDSTTTTAAAATTTTAGDSTGAERGGHTLGSGH